MGKLLMEDDLSKTFMEFEELYTEEIIHQNILVKFASILHPNTFPEKANPFFKCLDVFPVFGCVPVFVGVPHDPLFHRLRILGLF